MSSPRPWRLQELQEDILEDIYDMKDGDRTV